LLRRQRDVALPSLDSFDINYIKNAFRCIINYASAGFLDINCRKKFDYKKFLKCFYQNGELFTVSIRLATTHSKSSRFKIGFYLSYKIRKRHQKHDSTAAKVLSISTLSKFSTFLGDDDNNNN